MIESNRESTTTQIEELLEELIVIRDKIDEGAQARRTQLRRTNIAYVVLFVVIILTFGLRESDISGIEEKFCDRASNLTTLNNNILSLTDSLITIVGTLNRPDLSQETRIFIDSSISTLEDTKSLIQESQEQIGEC